MAKTTSTNVPPVVSGKEQDATFRKSHVTEQLAAEIVKRVKFQTF